VLLPCLGEVGAPPLLRAGEGRPLRGQEEDQPFLVGVGGPLLLKAGEERTRSWMERGRLSREGEEGRSWLAAAGRRRRRLGEEHHGQAGEEQQP